MTREDLKNYINNKKWIKGQIENYIEQRTIAEGLRAVVIDGMPKAKNKPNYAVENLMDKYNEILEYLTQEQEKLNQIVKQLDRMENTTHRNILFYIYIRQMSLEATAEEIGYSYYETCRQHGYALNEYDKLNVSNQTQDNANKSVVL